MSALAANAHVLCPEIHRRHQGQQQQCHQSSLAGTGLLLVKSCGFGGDGRRKKKKVAKRRDCRVDAFFPDLSRPASLDMEPIKDPDHLDRILVDASQSSQPILIDWMAAWCRKCIYLKPKLEKLAAEYENKVKFYYVDVNTVPQALVKRGNVSKMPTIQLWKDGEMKEQVIGGHQAWLVIDEVRVMIQKFV